MKQINLDFTGYSKLSAEALQEKYTAANRTYLSLQAAEQLYHSEADLRRANSIELGAIREASLLNKYDLKNQF
jgi:hypothetical protein|tara:strand:- start:413 stop:631 length:219 start_codon:yes stop_codon:yes gene_type:complete